MTNDTAAQVQVIAGVLGAPIETADLALQAAARGTRAEVAASLILAALAAAGYEVVKLPEPGSSGRWFSDGTASKPTYLHWSVGVSDGIPFAHARRGKGPESLAPKDHADFGLALLAAARHAEAAE